MKEPGPLGAAIITNDFAHCVACRCIQVPGGKGLLEESNSAMGSMAETAEVLLPPFSTPRNAREKARGGRSN